MKFGYLDCEQSSIFRNGIFYRSALYKGMTYNNKN